MSKIRVRTTGQIFTLYDIKAQGGKYRLVTATETEEEVVAQVNNIFAKQIKQGVVFNITPSKLPDVL
jgi:hypothetical protein